MGKVAGEEEEGEAIQALGSLFNLTQLHLWVNGSRDTQNGEFSEDTGLIQDLKDLGLPVSFQTNKQWKNKTRTYQKKGIVDQVEDVNVVLEEEEKDVARSTLDLVSDFSSVSDMKTLDLAIADEEVDRQYLENHCVQRFSVEEENHEFVEDVNVVLEEEEKDVVTSTLNLVSDFSSVSEHAIADEEVDRLCLENNCAQRISDEEENHEFAVGSICLGDGDKDSVLTSETTDSQSKLGDIQDSNEWKVYWDSFYGRSYFYNVKTQESTWQPPLGMEHLAYSDETHNLNELIIETTEKPCDELLRTGPSDDVPVETYVDHGGLCRNHCEKEAIEEASSFDTYPETSFGNQSLDITTHEEKGNGVDVVNSIKKAKKKTRRIRAKKIIFDSNIGIQSEGPLEEYSDILGKYWCQRYLLFSKFDEGIKMDEEGWFSVTPEPIAKHHATRCNGGIVIDCFAGVGGNAIQFALRSNYVIAVDVDPKKLDLAQHNAAIYGVADKIDFVKGDFFDLAPNLKAETVFLSPPWGGPDYVKASKYDMKTMLRPRDGDTLFKAAMNIASTIIMFLPRNVDINQLAELALSTSPHWSLEVEKNYLNGKLKAITAYYFKQT